MADASLPRGVDTTRPTDARVYDYSIGGKDNYASDRDFAAELADIFRGRTYPGTENRRFLTRAVRYLLDAGIRQFLDVGCGLPARENVHDIVFAAAPEATVVYVDRDPVAVTQYQALLSGCRTAAFQADARQPDDLLSHPDVKALIDLERPVGVLLVALMHGITDDERPAEIVARFRDTVAPGSHVVLSHLTADGRPPETMARLDAVSGQMREPLVMRSRERIRSFFDGLRLVEPGLVPGPEWRPDRMSRRSSGWLMAGVAVKDRESKSD